MTPRPGDPVPDFTLPDTSGADVPLRENGAAATVVVFTCNHCPYALAWHGRINAVARDYAGRGVRTLQICPNDAERYPRDAPDADHGDESLDAAWLRAALDAVLAGEPVAEPQTKPVGCSVKWRQ